MKCNFYFYFNWTKWTLNAELEKPVPKWSFIRKRFCALFGEIWSVWRDCFDSRRRTQELLWQQGSSVCSSKITTNIVNYLFDGKELFFRMFVVVDVQVMQNILSTCLKSFYQNSRKSQWCRFGRSEIESTRDRGYHRHIISLNRWYFEPSHGFWWWPQLLGIHAIESRWVLCNEDNSGWRISH